MRNLLILVLAAAMTLLLYRLHLQSTAIRALQQQQAQHIAGPAPNLELQASCAKQAQTYFRQQGFSVGALADFTNHYSSNFGRCFVVIKSTTINGQIIVTSSWLTDAFEGKDLGTYEWVNPGGKKYWEVAPDKCSVTYPSGEERVCQNSEEWENLIKVYTEAP